MYGVRDTPVGALETSPKSDGISSRSALRALYTLETSPKLAMRFALSPKSDGISKVGASPVARRFALLRHLQSRLASPKSEHLQSLGASRFALLTLSDIFQVGWRFARLTHSKVGWRSSLTPKSEHRSPVGWHLPSRMVCRRKSAPPFPKVAACGGLTGRAQTLLHLMEVSSLDSQYIPKSQWSPLENA